LKKVSIIVPVYNTEKYLEKCLDSLVNQTLDDIEIIVVNDGSPDNSKVILDKYAYNYPNKIRVFDKKNGGLSDARNFGLDKAEGEYIGFVDSDDYVEKNMYELLYNKAKSGDFDMVVGNLYMTYEDNNKKDIVKSGVTKDITNSQNLKELVTYIYPTAWNKIYKSEICKEVEFKKGVWFEDVEWLLRLYPKIKSIGCVDESLYNYLQRENSITYTFNEKLYHLIDNMDGVIDYYIENKFYEGYKEELEYLYARYAFATFMKRLAKSKDKKAYKEGYKYAIKKVKNKFPQYKKNKYLKSSGLKGIYIKNFGKIFASINYFVNKNKKYN